jgi:hypothetical protein
MARVKYEIIECPECGRYLVGEIYYSFSVPFGVYRAKCEDCDYDILESEWKTVNGCERIGDHCNSCYIANACLKAKHHNDAYGFSDKAAHDVRQ